MVVSSKLTKYFLHGSDDTNKPVSISFDENKVIKMQNWEAFIWFENIIGFVNNDE